MLELDKGRHFIGASLEEARVDNLRFFRGMMIAIGLTIGIVCAGALLYQIITTPHPQSESLD
jgi:hypothetical protein